MLQITADLAIPESELAYRYSRSSGPGGQNVNKVATKVTLLFDVDDSPSLDDDQRDLVRERLANRISRDGVLRVTSERHRTRSANQRDATARFEALLADALYERPPRRRTRIPAKARKHRLESKRRRSRLKELRSKPIDDG